MARMWKLGVGGYKGQFFESSTLVNVENGIKCLFLYSELAGLWEMLKYLKIFIENIAEPIYSFLRDRFPYDFKSPFIYST